MSECTYDSHDGLEPGEIAARHRLVNTMRMLPYSGTQAPMVPSDFDENTWTFLDRCVAWLEAYARNLRAVSKSAASMTAELHDLRNERAAVRAFLGIDN